MEKIPFVLTAEFIELFKLLKVTGVCESGGAAKYAILDAKVKVDGQVEMRKACKIRKGQQVEFGAYAISVE